MEFRGTASSLPNWTRGWAKALLLLMALGLSLGIAQTKSVHIAGFFPLTPDPQGRLGRGVLPAVHLALKHINDNPRVLKGYHLDIIYNDTKVGPTGLWRL
uniref:Receptor ligand binding region domain-containing protein n=1 Tax=Strigamia maritima TaxID=126957 RepID=T1JBF9_STRMM